MATVDVGKVANALNLTPRRVQQLAKDEGLPREAGGQYDPIKCMMWYIRYMQRLLEIKSEPTLDGGDRGERVERVRLLRAHADLREMELGRERSQVVAIDDAKRALADLALITTSRIMAIPSRLAPELVGEGSRVMIQAKIEKALKQELRVLAKANQASSQSERRI